MADLLPPLHQSRTSHQNEAIPLRPTWVTTFASDVTAAMLVVKNKRVSLRWEMNSIFMQILQKKFFCIDHQHGRLVTWLQTKNWPAPSVWVFIGQLVEHCSANTEAMGLNRVEATEKLFSG